MADPVARLSDALAGRYRDTDRQPIPKRGAWEVRGSRSHLLGGCVVNASTQILILGGMGIVACGFLLGVGMIATRTQAARAPRYLLAAHLATLIQGGLLLGVAAAVRFSHLGAALETTGAALLVGGIVLFDLGLVWNWIRGVQDGFGEKSLGNKLSALGTPFVLVGFAILCWGVLAGVA